MGHALITIHNNGEKDIIKSLEDVFKRSDIVNVIKRSKLEWAARVEETKHHDKKKWSKKTQEAKDLQAEQDYVGKIRLKEIFEIPLEKNKETGIGKM